jgi:GntR family transcriptional regulator, trigonelline degradation regulator
MPETPEFTPIEQFPAPLRQVVIARLRGAIISGLLKPGDRLVESRLTEVLKVSRPSLREAMRQLESEGLIEIQPHRGPIVKVLSREEAKHVYDLREVVEALCARYFSINGTEEQIERLSESVDAVEAALKSEQREAIVQAKHRYYEAFVAGCGSDLVRNYVRQLIARTSYLWSSSIHNADRPAESIGEMRRLVEAIRAREPELAATASAILVRHASMTGLSALDKLAQSEPVAATARRKRG